MSVSSGDHSEEAATRVSIVRQNYTENGDGDGNEEFDEGNGKVCITGCSSSLSNTTSTGVSI